MKINKGILILTLALSGALLLVYFFLKDIKFSSPKQDKANRMFGIDISHYQEVYNWKAIEDSFDFVIMKATEGATFKDTKFKNYWKSAKKHNLYRGAYHFFVANVSAEKQFENFKNSVSLEKGDFVPFLDVEYKEVDLAELNKWVDLATKHYGVKPIIYSDFCVFKFFLNGKVDVENLWISLPEKYKAQPAFKGYNCVLWQYSHVGRVKGIKDAVDLDVFVDSLNNFSKYLVK